MKKIVLLYKRHAQPDDHVLTALESALKDHGYDIFIDRHLNIGVQWANAIEGHIRNADAVIAILSDAVVGSEMLEYELSTVADERRKRGRPHLLPVRVGTDQPLTGSIGSYVNDFHYFVWRCPEDDERVVDQIIAVLESSMHIPYRDLPLEPAGGAVPPTSRFYTVRPSDAEFEAAVRANESVILVKGPRQIGKTSLLGRGAKLVDDLGWRQVSTDFQMLSETQLQDADKFCRVLAATLAKQLGFHYDFENEWLDVFGPNMNLGNFIRALLEDSPKPLVWFMDEADRLFVASFANDFFGLVRSWHNARATNPMGPWSRFTIVIGYATEARLFIRDLNQSPFNVGRQISLQPFSLEQTVDLNERYGSPIKRRSDVEALHYLVNGQPFLTRRALEVIASEKMDFATLVETADRDDGPFGDHLKRILISVSHVPEVLNALRASLNSLPMVDTDAMHRLIAAGVLKETPDQTATLACDLYTQYLAPHVR